MSEACADLPDFDEQEWLMTATEFGTFPLANSDLATAKSAPARFKVISGGRSDSHG